MIQRLSTTLPNSGQVPQEPVRKFPPPQTGHCDTDLTDTHSQDACIHQCNNPSDGVSEKEHQRLNGSEADVIESVSSELSSELLGDIRSYVDLPDTTESIRKVPRAEFLPYLFRLRGKPYSLKDREQFNVMYDNEYVPETVFICGRQTGKCACKILGVNNLRRANGSFISPADIHVGDLVQCLGDNMKTTTAKVTAVMSPGSKDMLKITTRLNNEITVSPEHRIRTCFGYVPAGSLKPGDRVSVVRKSGVFGNSEIPEGRIRITAYMLGDGSCRHSYSFTNMCKDVIDDIVSYDNVNTRVSYSESRNAYVAVFRRKHDVYRWADEDGMAGKYSYEKSFPEWVFNLNEHDSSLFISCLWATDGSIKLDRGFAAITYTSTSKDMIRDLRSMLNKFGILTSVRSHNPRSNGKIFRTAYEIRVVGTESQIKFLNTFDVPGKPKLDVSNICKSNRDTFPVERFRELISSAVRKMPDKWHERAMRKRGFRIRPVFSPSRDKVGKWLDLFREKGLDSYPEFTELNDWYNGDVVYDAVKTISREEPSEAYDLEIETYHNFILDNVVVHNSLNLSRSEVMDCLSVPELQLLYVAPLQSQTQRYSTLYLTEAIKSCELARQLQSKSLEGKLSDSKIVTAVGHQSFANGAGIQLTYAKTSPDRARGIYADRIDFDEVQDQLIDNIPVISESLTSSKWGVRKYTGTAKTVDNAIEHFWQQSSKCEWAMKCEHCGGWNIPNEDGNVLDMIQADGLHCVLCGGKINTRCGEWVPEFPDRMNDFRGYHIPQIILPAIAENPEAWAKIVRKVLRQPLPIVMQECLGISYSVGSRIISENDVKKMCVLPGVEELKKNLHRYAHIVSGIDWGGAEQSSFTVHVILGITISGRIDVLWARRFIGFNPDEVFTEIAKAHRFYGAEMCAADYGMGYDKNVILEQRFGMLIAQMQFVHQNKLLSYNPILGHARWTISKTAALDILFMSIKNGRMCFPPWEAFEIYLKDLLSPYEQVSESGGLTSRRYLRNPAQPDDFCMALCFGTMLAMKLLYGEDEVNIIPQSAFGGGMADGEPVDIAVDPQDVLSSM